MNNNTNEVSAYMANDEEISYTLSHRPRGVLNWIRSLLGYGVTHWHVTNQRVIEHTKVAGGFNFRDVQMGKVSSIEYGQRLNLILVGLGAFLSLSGLVAMFEEPAALLFLLIGLGMVAWAFYRRSQALIIKASGGVTLSLSISQGEKVDEFLWYAHVERQKHASTTTSRAAQASAD